MNTPLASAHPPDHHCRCTACRSYRERVLLRRATGVLRDLERVLGAPIPLLKEIDAEVGS